LIKYVVTVRGGEGKANDEWVYSGSTVGLQWVYNE